jgi:hypothetical protein
VTQRAASRAQNAVRLLFLLRHAGELPRTPPDPVGTTRVIRSELRLHALDFWLRNPDYLADELLTEVEASRLDVKYVEVAAHLLTDPEPTLRRYPMHRWLFGAYEPLDDAAALLESVGLMQINRTGRTGAMPVSRTQFFLTERGLQAADELLESDEAFSWYPRQISLVAAVARDDPGSRLKQRQYRQAEYANTELGSRIAPIHDRVRRRLAEFGASEVPA